MKRCSYIPALIIFLLASCTEVIDFEVKDAETKLAVDGSITTEQKAHRVILTESTGYFDSEGVPAITGADVTISDADTTFLLTETEPGIYETDSTVKGEPGKTYTLKINHGNEEYTATAELLPVVDLDTIIVTQLFNEEPITGEIDSSFTILFSAQEPKGSGDYYLWKYYINNTLGSDTVSEFAFSDDFFVDGSDVTLYPIYNFPKANGEVGDIVRLEMYAISESYYDFLMSLLQQTVYRNPMFSGPPANIPSNISNNAVGYFYAADVSKKETIILFKQ